MSQPTNHTINAWDVPVVEALDRIEALPGASPDRVEWDAFRFSGPGLPGRPMDRVAVHAFPADGGRVAFRSFADGRFEMTSEAGATLTPSDLPAALGVPVETAAETTALIAPALASALHAYNDAHTQDPAAWRRTQATAAAHPRETRPAAAEGAPHAPARAHQAEPHIADVAPEQRSGGRRL